MACYHPNVRYYEVGDSEHFHIISLENWLKTPNLNKTAKYTWQEIPCGKCIGCRLEKSKTWAMRCMLEAKDWEQNEFITLTYDEEHVPRSKGVIDFETGEIGEVLTLNFDDLTKFMKRLRIEFKRKFKIDNIRFYACGEYGSKTERPHFHIICFNCPLPDKKMDEISAKGSVQYKSEWLEKIWGMGRVRTSPVNFETCAYVARYVMKKAKGKQAVELFEDTGRIPEDVRMSRRPGIARKYFDENKQKIYECDEIWLKNKYGPIKMKPPRYYDNLYDLEEPEKMEKIKENRVNIAKKTEKSRLNESGIDKITYLENMEEYKRHQIQRLKRQLQ